MTESKKNKTFENCQLSGMLRKGWRLKAVGCRFLMRGRLGWTALHLPSFSLRPSVLSLVSTVLLLLLPIAAQADETQRITDGLVCHLTFDGDTLDHSNSAGANHGTARCQPPYDKGRISDAIVLHGDRGQCVDLGQPADLHFGDAEDFSVAMWVRVDASGTWPVLITNKDYSSKPAGNSATHTGWGLFLHTDKKLRWNAKDLAHEALYLEHVGPSFADGAWHHVAATHARDGRAVAYVDGRSVGSVYMGCLNGTLDTGLPTVIGNDGIFGMGAWDGATDDFGIWRRALTPGEIWSVYSAGLEGVNLAEAPALPSLFDCDVDCCWLSEESGPRLAVTVTNHSGTPLAVSDWRLEGPGANAFVITSAPSAQLGPGESVRGQIGFDLSKADPEGKNEARLLFDHNATNLESAFSVDLARQVRRLPYRYRFDEFEARMGQPAPRNAQGQIIVNDGYHDPAMIEQLLKAFAEDYPSLTRLHEIGTTWQQRPLWALKISADVAEEADKPAFLFVGAHHGNELLSTEYVLDIIEYLTTNYQADPQVRQWLDQYEIWCLPLANPDGCHNFFHVTASGRKNGRDTNGNGLVDYSDGVDINRNYPFRWHSLGEEGSKSDPLAAWYRGPEPGSEPEPQAIMKLADRERFVGLISYHTAGTKVLVPYTIDNCRPPRPNTAWILAGHMAALSDSERDNREYIPVHNLYPVDGTDQDWHFWRHGTMAYIWEGSRTNPPYADRDRYAAGVRPGWQYLLNRLAEGPTLSGHVRDAASGIPLEAEITLEEIRTFEGEVHTSHPVSGRFDRYLPRAGRYRLHATRQGYQPVSQEVEVGREWKTIELKLTPGASSR